jgi:Uncharacterised protein family (UPF0236)
VSTLGVVELKRRYVYCDECKTGFCPSHKELGLPETAFTAHLEEVVTMMAASVPYELATKLVAKASGIEVSVKATEEMIERRATALIKIDELEAARLCPLQADGLEVDEQQYPAIRVESAPNVAYLEIDGVVPMTREVIPTKELSSKDKRRVEKAKVDKARGGKGRRYVMGGREVKNAVLYTDDKCAKLSANRGSILEKTYVSWLGNWLVFAGLVWVAILRLRFDNAKQLVVLSDGAEWIRSLVAWLPLEAMMILDLFHVKHRIWEVADAVYGAKTRRAGEWARTQCDRIEAGHAGKVLHALAFLKSSRKEALDLVKKLDGYLRDNRDRMNYPEYRKRGLRVTTSAVESANYHVTGARLKLQGMRWSESGARNMAVLRADLFNGVWDARTEQLLAA